MFSHKTIKGFCLPMMKTKPLLLFCFISLYLLSNALLILSQGGGPGGGGPGGGGPGGGGDSVSYLLGCGATEEGVDGDGRKWEPDDKHLVSPGDSFALQAKYQDPSLPSTVPYMSARVITSEVKYSFKLPKVMRHWIRLHFYPSDYGNYEAKNAYFTVVAGGVTLLKNFNSSVSALALTQSYVIKEYSLYPNADELILTISPSTDHKGAYAFVNGIEVISMPNLFQSAKMVGFEDSSIDTTGSIMQTMYRLNVGGQYIPPSKDSGLTRTWYDDTPYMEGAGFGVTAQIPQNEKILYTKDVPEFMAPVEVYSTSRSMGPDSNVNKNTNLTWVFQVDSNFTYFARLHFCEFDNQTTKANQRVFDITINNQSAVEGADVLIWSDGKKDTPVFKDYAILVNEKIGDDVLAVTLRPNMDMAPETYDTLLNGVEIFKLNDTMGNLAGPNPVISDYMIRIDSKREEKQHEIDAAYSRKRKVVGGVVCGVALGLMAILYIAVYQKKRGVGSDPGGPSGWLPLYGSWTNSKSTTTSGKSCSSSTLSSLAQGLCRHFSLAEMKAGTRNFEESQVIGVGGFGKVYKGVVDGTTKVAVKRANPSSEQGVHEFRTEIEMLSKLRHRHLVSLIGFCEENDEMVLVYDYMGNGTLREHLYKSNKPHLSWKQRLEICIGAARGLYYLHTGAKYTIIHRDVKTTNILLDDNWVAKVSDFGLSKTGPDLNQSHVSTVVKGSFGYLDPEYFRRQQLTDKSDVYSFGVVLFEVLCARPALNPTLPKEQVSLADWALHCQRKGILEDIIDPHLKGKINPECLKKFAETAEKCLSDQGIHRPSMGDVLWNLEFALQMQENPNGASLLADEKARASANRPQHRPVLSFGDESIDEDSSDGQNSNAVFSQLINPQGR